jgi:hypothetical protein
MRGLPSQLCGRVEQFGRRFVQGSEWTPLPPMYEQRVMWPSLGALIVAFCGGVENSEQFPAKVGMGSHSSVRAGERPESTSIGASAASALRGQNFAAQRDVPSSPSTRADRPFNTRTLCRPLRLSAAHREAPRANRKGRNGVHSDDRNREFLTHEALAGLAESGRGSARTIRGRREL